MENYLTHTIIYNSIIDNYIIDWDNIGKIKAMTTYLRKECLPVTEEIVQQVYDNCKYKESLLSPCQVYTNNPLFINLKVYRLNTTWVKQGLEALKLDTADDSFNWDSIEDIEDYIFTFIDPIKDKLKENIKTLYNPKVINQEMFMGDKKPYHGQVPLIQAGIEVLKRDRFVYLACEQGIGKTPMAAKIIHSYNKQKNKENYTCLVVAPAITITQWQQELKECINDDIDVVIIRKTIDFIKWYNRNNYNMQVNRPTFFYCRQRNF